MEVHELKTWPEPFQAIWDKKKAFEIRKNDRGFEVGDMLCLREYDPNTRTYSGREVEARVSYLMNADSVPEPSLAKKYVVMSIEPTMWGFPPKLLAV